MEVVTTSEFRKNYSKLLREGFKKSTLDDEISTVTYYLMSGRAMPDGYDDHQLEDNLSDFRELHLEGDLLMMYRVTPRRITLANVGTHEMLFKTRLQTRPQRTRGKGFWSLFD